jgi:NAD-dependent dihydropyrimidine dehydrogenase PreA subunit
VAYVTGLPRPDVVDRVHEGGRALDVHRDECADRGACEPVGPVEAISFEDHLRESPQEHRADNARSFAEPVPGRNVPPGGPGDAATLGRLGVDTTPAAGRPRAT